MNLSKFKELNIPRKETGGIHADKWFVTAKGTDMCLKNDLSYELLPIEITNKGNAKFFFNTLSDAFNCSAAYYMTNGVMYPYTDDWQAAQVLENAMESQVMEFI